MILTAITNLEKVTELQQVLENKLTRYCGKPKYLKVGSQHGNFELELYYSNKLNIWCGFQNDRTDTKFWNAFGVGKPGETKSNSIIVEINYGNQKKPNFRTASLWAEDNKHKYYLLHSGEIGGGKKGIGKETFYHNYDGSPIEVELSNKNKDYFLISALDDKNFAFNVSDFVKEVHLIKKQHKTKGKSQSYHDEKKYFDEFYGTKTFTVNRTIKLYSQHGKIVKALNKQLQKLGLKTGKTNLFDLCVYRNKKISKLFEVKTAITNQNIYSAIGQLYLYSDYYDVNPSKIFVCPDGIDNKLRNSFTSLGIKVLTFKIQNNQILFPGLHKI